MKKTVYFHRIVCMVLALLLLSVPALATQTETDMSIEQGCRTIEGKKSLLGPMEELALAPSVFFYDKTNETLVYATNPDAPQYPAGLVKLMTALIISKKGNMDDMVTVKQESIEACYGSYGIDLQAGEVMSMHDLMYAILIEGANLATIVAVDHVSDNTDAFIAEMNAYAKELGCTGTNFTNLYGFHDDQQVTTARDMAKILNAVCDDPIVWEAFSTYAYRTSATNMADERRLYNPSFIFNKNLGSNHYDARVTGCKIGETTDGARNIVATAGNDNMDLIGVILGSTSEITPDGNHGFYKELRILMSTALNGHYSSHILHENQVVEQFPVKNGDSDLTVCVKDNIKISLPNDISTEDLNYLYTDGSNTIEAPVKAGDRISTLQIWYHDVCIAQSDVYALHNVKVKEVIATEDAKVNRESSSFTVLTVVVVIVGLLAILLFGRNFIFRIIHKQQLRRQKNQRRRSR